MKLLALIALIYLSFSLAVNNKTTKKTTLSKTSTVILQKFKNTSTCYQYFKGYYRGKYYNTTEKKNCNTNCFSYKFKMQNFEEIGSGCSSVEECIGGYLTIKPQINYEFSCCTQNLCNMPEYSNKLLTDKCEQHKKLDKSKKLIFPSVNLNATNVQQCYNCEGCISDKCATIFNCSDIGSPNAVYACQVFIIKTL